ncbi:hypothetical protein SAMN04487910_3725 [Aquimarina amphilecti]|uniref:Uncharacterized protein n=1 Tax=Aquimarina amphilecti TaxID=1038014 RepID=A0A1H7UHK2_AQUAM|nr:hypothetical protein [Aquimarina amphilecti]SEL96108.1 hypothetical protein SAMN04487910_3725 [Aquimarina amphilecti]
MKKNRKLKQLKLNKKIISNLQFKQISGGHRIATYYHTECGPSKDRGCELLTISK